MNTYFNAIDGDMDCIEADGSWGPVSAVGPVGVGTDEHVLTGSVEGGISESAATQWKVWSACCCLPLWGGRSKTQLLKRVVFIHLNVENEFEGNQTVLSVILVLNVISSSSYDDNFTLTSGQLLLGN